MALVVLRAPFIIVTIFLARAAIHRADVANREFFRGRVVSANITALVPARTVAVFTAEFATCAVVMTSASLWFLGFLGARPSVVKELTTGESITVAVCRTSPIETVYAS